MSPNNGEGLRADGKIKSIVFDLGGVLFTEGKSVAIRTLSRDYGYDPAVIGEILTCACSRDMRKGLISEKTFWRWVEGEIPQHYDAQTIRDEWYEGYVLDQDIFELVQKLKGEYRLVAFSENIRDRIEYLDKKYRFRELFDVEIYSYDHGVGKRDSEFIDILLTTLGDCPSEILYIDNTLDALSLAKKRGLNVVHYTTGQMKEIKPVIRQLGVPV